MYEFYPYFTNDGSVGLFSKVDNDIYHSTYGALTEAYEKFILPSNLFEDIKNKTEIKILDICYGIGYNSKSAINFLIENYYNDTIYTNNTNIQNSNEKIYTDNNFRIDFNKNPKNSKNLNIYIKAIDTDKILAFLSPFIICNKKKLPSNYKLPFKNEKISKMLNKPPKNKIKFFDEINLIFYEKITKKYPEIYNDKDLKYLLNSKEYLQFFDSNIRRLFKFKQLERYSPLGLRRLFSFLHNIYYRNISNSYKKRLNSLLNKSFIFDLKINDARQEVKSDNQIYDYIFLDAFTPAKCPALWTVDFFKELYKHLDDNGMILTYSNSAAIRNAFLNAEFFVGKIFNPTLNKFTGTIAVKNKALIKHELTEYDLGLVKTKAGIFYRDENLNSLNETIIERHNLEVEISNLISSSKFIKNFKNKQN